MSKSMLGYRCGITEHVKGAGVVSKSMSKVHVWCHRACHRCRCGVKEHVIGTGVVSQSMCGVTKQH